MEINIAKCYYNTNTAEIAKEANVSTGIIYQYFKDKHDILIAGIEKYGDDIFYPMLKLNDNNITKENFSDMVQSMIHQYIKEHKISKEVHEEISAMAHIDHEVADYFYRREMALTNQIYSILSSSIQEEGLLEKVHIIIGIIDNLCHEIVYHKHNELNYTLMEKQVIQAIENIIIS